GHGQEARREDGLPAFGLPGRLEGAAAARGARAAAGRGAAQGGQGNAPEEPAGAEAAVEAQDLCGPGASARGAGSRTARGEVSKWRRSLSTWARGSARR